MPETEHTPTPWHLHDMEAFTVCGPDHDAVLLSEATRRSSDENQANAAFIVLACNAHEELWDELEKAADTFDDFIKALTLFNRHAMADAAQIAVTHIRAVLAKAIGETSG